MVLSQQTRGYISSSIDVRKTTTDSSAAMLRLVLGLGMFDGVLKIDVGATGGMCWRSQGSYLQMAFETLCRKSGRDGIRRGRQSGGLLVGGYGSGCYGGKAVLTSPEAFARLRNVDRVGNAGEGKSETGATITVNRSHI